MKVYYEHTELDDEIDRETVASETDMDVLQKWAVGLRTIERELLTMIGSMKLADEPPTSMVRKLGFIRIAKNRVSDRIVELGGEVGDDVYGKKLKTLRHQMTMMQQKLEAQNKKLKALRAENEALKAKTKEAA